MRRTVLAAVLLALTAPASAQVKRCSRRSGDREVFGFMPLGSTLATAGR